MSLTHVSLFSGIGGDSLAAEWAGFEHILFCEIDPFCQKVLNKNFPGVPIIGDVHDVTRQSVATYAYNSREQQPQGSEQNIGGRIIDRNQTEIASNSQGVKEYSRGCGNVAVKASGRQGSHAAVSSGNQLTLLTAGVPCQPASAAGKRLGKKDNRWLWPEAIRVLSELKPAWAVFENPAGIGSLGELGSFAEMDGEAYQTIPDREAVELSNIIRDIEAQGYEVQSVCIPACGVGAPHRRHRIFIIAHADFGRCKQCNTGFRTISKHCEGNTPDWNENWIEVATRFCRVDARVSDRVHRLKALGNAIVPQQIYPVLKAIADIEMSKELSK